MAIDKAVDSAALDGVFSGIADAIRRKTGGAVRYTKDQMAAAIDGIETNGGASVETYTVTPTANALSVSVNMPAEPKAFLLISGGQFTSSAVRCITAVLYDGNSLKGNCDYQSSSRAWGASYAQSAYSKSYSGGKLTVSSDSASTGGYFKGNTPYVLVAVF